MQRRRRWRWRWTKLDAVWALGIGLIIREAFRHGEPKDGLLYAGLVLIGVGLGLRWNGGLK